MKKHNERCKDCKKRIYELLVVLYGEDNVFKNYNLKFPIRIEELEIIDGFSDLERIYRKLQECRGFKSFVRSKWLRNVDYYISDHFILEFDESQHFTKPRLIAIENYPEKLSLGFDKWKWMGQCKKLDRRDNDPAFRDEQRAWYDTIRDFIPAFRDIKPTKRLYASDYPWCSLDATKNEDLELFKSKLGE